MFTERRSIHLRPRTATLLLVAAAFAGTSATAEVFCPSAGAQGGFGGTFSAFAGTLDGTCGADSGVTLAIPLNTDYAKLTWNPASGVTLGTLGPINAAVTFWANQSTDGPYFELAFVDPGCNLGQCTGSGSATDQILAIGYGDTSIPNDSMVHTTTLAPGSTLLHLYDNTTGTDLEGGIAGAETLDGWLGGVLAPDSSEVVTELRLAIGLAGPGAGPSAESLSVNSVEITPEPGTFVLLGCALGILGATRRLRRAGRPSSVR